MRRFLFLFVCLFAFQAHAAITITATGKNRMAASATNVITTTADCPVGSAEVLDAADTTLADTLSSVTDSGSNTWVVVENISGTGVLVAWAYALNTTGDVASGGTVTATFAGSSVSAVAVACLSGVASSGALDKQNLTDQGLAATASATVNSGVLAVGGEIVLSGLATATTSGAMACINTFLEQSTAAQTPTIGMCYFLRGAGITTSVASSFTWATSSNFVTDMISLKPVASVYPSVLTLGVGP